MGIATTCREAGRYAIELVRKLEATGGIEPPNRGFADPRLNHLATSPREPLAYRALARRVNLPA